MPVLPLGFLRAAGNMQYISYVLISVALRCVCVLHLALSFLSGSLYLHTHAEQVQTPHCWAGIEGEELQLPFVGTHLPSSGIPMLG